MWAIIGSWPAVGVVFLVGAVALTVAARRTGRGFLAGVALIAAGLRDADVDPALLSVVREAGVDLDPYACRDALRTRYLVIGTGYLAATLGAAALIGRRRRLVQ